MRLPNALRVQGWIIWDGKWKGSTINRDVVRCGTLRDACTGLRIPLTQRRSAFTRLIYPEYRPALVSG
ncbi:hypothetical protein K431DRAFT_143765 [Polychaeton citri CBS 116435]|uniref:Uncharacterized protein n=1 Tax=Polychaeton citri CBS 116435 TaxID=1314669 RepID=A0A9P4UJH2_9PEZI|nr:hypothetical protein K431DRAFT_143765 [Polychaeton citri CBS 116435]